MAKNEAMVKHLFGDDTDAAKTAFGNNSMFLSPQFKILAADVRDSTIIKDKLVNELGVDTSLPTLVLTECLLIYMKGEDSLGVLTWLRELFTGDIGVVNYEVINPDDPFGRTMVENLENRGC